MMKNQYSKKESLFNGSFNSKLAVGLHHPWFPSAPAVTEEAVLQGGETLVDSILSILTN